MASVNVIEIKFSRDLENPLHNRLRAGMELAAWKAEMRAAKLAEDWDKMERLDRQYEYIGLP